VIVRLRRCGEEKDRSSDAQTFRHRPGSCTPRRKRNASVVHQLSN
jgi:hypothetical protein